MHEKHWVTCCINLLCKELNTFDSIRSTKKGCATEKVISNLVCKLVLFQAFLSFLLSHIFVLFHYFIASFLLFCWSADHKLFFTCKGGWNFPFRHINIQTCRTSWLPAAAQHVWLVALSFLFLKIFLLLAFIYNFLSFFQLWLRVLRDAVHGELGREDDDTVWQGWYPLLSQGHCCRIHQASDEHRRLCQGVWRWILRVKITFCSRGNAV